MSDFPENTVDAERRIAFTIAPAMAREVDRIMEVTDLSKQTDVFRSAFTLLRIHVNAAQEGKDILIVDPKRPGEKLMIALPFTVTRHD